MDPKKNEALKESTAVAFFMIIECIIIYPLKVGIK